MPTSPSFLCRTFKVSHGRSGPLARASGSAPFSCQSAAGYLNRITSWILCVRKLESIDFMDYAKLQTSLFLLLLEAANVSDAKDDLYGCAALLRGASLV